MLRMIACEKAIRKEFSNDTMFSYLYSVPGFGLITIANIVSIVVYIERFENAKAFSAYFGIVPKQRESRGSAPRCHITIRGNKIARKMLLQSTFVRILNDPERLSPISQMYDRLVTRGFPHKRVLTAAGNKMAIMVFAILKTEWPRNSESSGTLQRRNVQMPKTKSLFVRRYFPYFCTKNLSEYPLGRS